MRVTCISMFRDHQDKAEPRTAKDKVNSASPASVRVCNTIFGNSFFFFFALFFIFIFSFLPRVSQSNCPEGDPRTYHATQYVIMA